MARIRTIKPEFFTSPSTAAVDFPVRIFYQALWCWADDFGVGETNLNGLLGFAFPDSDGFTAQDLRRFCADVAQHFGVTFYTVRGRHYYAVQNWEKHQKLEKRTERRRYPAPDDPDATPDLRIYERADSAPILRSNIGANPCESLLEQGNRGTEEQRNRGAESVSAIAEVVDLAPQAPPKATPTRGTRLPQGWMPERNTVDNIRSQFPAVTNENLKFEHENFADWAASCTTKAAVKRDWNAAWRTWMRRELVKYASGTGTRRDTGTQRAYDALDELSARYAAETNEIMGELA